jgi:DNA-binding beta-propeller fold protein YncE
VFVKVAKKQEVVQVRERTNSLRRYRAALAIVLGVAALASLGGSMAAPRTASAGELVWKGCISAQDRGTVRRACTTVKEDAVFREPFTLALSPDGRSLYTGSGIFCNDNQTTCNPSATVGRFDRDGVTGALDYRDCLTGTRNPRIDCERIPGAAKRGAGLGDISTVVVSPDGRSLYVASTGVVCDDEGCYGGNALASFDRDPETGMLTYTGCITWDKRNGPSGSGACSEIPSATARGRRSGLDEVRSLALSADGRSLYAGAAFDDSVATFDRDPRTGALAYSGCITGDRAVGPSGSGACAAIPTATWAGQRSGLNGSVNAPYPVIVSPEDGSVYVGATGDVSLAQFDRDPATGELAYLGCIGGKYSRARSACTQVSQPLSVDSPVISPDGRFVYLARQGFIALLHRDPDSGTLTYVRSDGHACGRLKLGCGTAALGADGRALYAAGGSNVAHFRVKPGSSRLRYQGCLAGDKQEKRDRPCREIPHAGYASGLHGIQLLAARGSTLYATSYRYSSAIARFALAPQTRIAGGPKGKTRRHRAVFKFRSGESSKFKCKLKGQHVKRKHRQWRHCGSRRLRHQGRQVYRHLGPGRKVFKVRATDRARTTDPTPAKRRWRVR